MRSTLSLPAALAAVILLACNTGVYAHTWVEELRLIASNGSFVGTPGYIRNFGPRKPGVNIDAVNSHLLPANGGTNAFTSTDLLCKSNQLKGQQTPEYPALTAGPGDQVALRYLENGHVSQFSVNAGKPAGRGTVFIYGTKQSLDSDTYVGVHRVWNADGTGGDKRGKLLATRPYDDGRCAQVNNNSPVAVSRLKALDSEGTEVMCQNDFKIPTDAGTSGTYTLYWVWEWPTLDKNGAVATNESYTSCMDVNMTPNTVSTVGKFAGQPVGQEANAVAIEAQMGDEQFLIDPTALPVLTSDNLPAGATGVPAPKPKVGGGAADPTAAPVVTTSKAVQSTSTSAPAQGFKTVTVTAKEIETVYITRDPSTPTSSASSKSAAKTVLTSTITVRQPSASASATASSSAPPVYNTAFTSFTAVPMSSVLATAVPSPSPFLTPYNQVQQAGVHADAGAGADEAATSSSSSCPTPAGRRKRSRIEGRSSDK